MINQRNKSKINFIIAVITSILFFYISFTILIILKNIYLQIIILLVDIYIFINVMYKYIPNYTYKIIDNEIFFIREFSERYYDDYRLKIEDIEFFAKSENYSLKFWNEFYNMNRENDIYIIKTKNIVIKFDPNEKFIEAIKTRMKRVDE
jgi:hypothetical protein